MTVRHTHITSVKPFGLVVVAKSGKDHGGVNAFRKLDRLMYQRIVRAAVTAAALGEGVVCAVDRIFEVKGVYVA